MTSVSAAARPDLPALPPAQAPAAVPARPAPSSPSVSTSVTLGRGDAGTALYAPDGSLPTAARIWQHSANDSVTLRMAANFGTAGAAARLDGLGAALLERAMDGGEFSQSVWRAGSSALSLDGVQANLAAPQTGNYAALEITTASGTTVRIAIGSQDDAMSVQMQVAGGTLSDTERAALAQLSKGFQAALDGLAAQPPKLDLSGLTAYDATAIASIDLHASIKTSGNQNQTLDFHADAGSRSVRAQGPQGTVQVSVDMSDPAMLGSPAQRERAIQNYLQQFDAAGSRGRGDATLVNMFKSAFADLHNNHGSAARQGGPMSRAGSLLTDTSRGMLTGLADFSASMSESPQPVNPLRPAETDGFSYQASQQTDTGSRGARHLSLRQTQHSDLSASFHDPLSPGQSLVLTADPRTQNYYYYQLKDSATSTTELAFEDGKLARATLHQTADQSRRTMKYVGGRLEQDLSTPLHQERSWNLLALVEAAQRYDGATARPDGSRLRQTLSAIGQLVLLQADPARLDGKPTGASAASE